ncbi:hypothetical protein ACJJIC_05380 [Microbulbifer sp. ANSA002]|uniref:hypothetical protein n=1 Tax=unclassified Microbulbifer TaxID=2619833 RepID=UPI004041C561
MSLISTFWTIDTLEINTPLVESKPVEHKIGKKPLLPFIKHKTEMVFPWFDALKKYAQEESTYQHSGMVMIDFDSMLSEKAESIFNLSLPEARLLSEYCGGSTAIIDHRHAKTLAETIENVSFSESDVTKFYDADKKLNNCRFDPKDILYAGEHLILWCSKVTPEKLGILVIG